MKFVPEGRTEEIVPSKGEIARVPKTRRKQRTPKKAKHCALEDVERRKTKETTQVFADLEQEEDANEKKDEKDMPKMPGKRRSRRAPEWYGLLVYICGAEKKKKVVHY